MVLGRMWRHPAASGGRGCCCGPEPLPDPSPRGSTVEAFSRRQGTHRVREDCSSLLSLRSCEQGLRGGVRTTSPPGPDSLIGLGSFVPAEEVRRCRTRRFHVEEVESIIIVIIIRIAPRRGRERGERSNQSNGASQGQYL